ncbi:hypothetical protein [Salinibacter ruber]|uniref:Uncharacterized protein n=1 Tax=Salinibacter ruber TaxID=146919 RepID=A0A9X2V1V2_9BACT|nr:hypothetical protein [Salinibacter ruber]MCS3701377.1 hypothetical protein [Salinibacter ruber]MCS4119699.1 hypothetical protein [Salinibacter ruber]
MGVFGTHPHTDIHGTDTDTTDTETMDQDSTSNPTGTVDPAARESIQRALD